MASSSRFRLWLHPVHGDENLMPVKLDTLSCADTVEERLSILTDVAAAQATELASLSDISTPTEVYFERGDVVARSRLLEKRFAFPVMFSLLGFHRNNLGSEVSALAGVLSCTFTSESPELPWEEKGDSSVIKDVFNSSEVWLLLVTTVDGDEFPVKARAADACDDVLEDALATFGRLGAVCSRFRGHTFSQHTWENARIGAGATAAVVLLREPSNHGRHAQGQTQRSYAMKVWSSKTKGPVILREARSLLQAQNHPNICRFVGVFRSVTWTGEHQWLMIMEAYLQGDLKRIMKRDGAFAELEALRVAKCVLQALEHIHEHGIIHRDVKLENVVLNADGDAVLVDFGMSVRVSEKHALKKKCGTPGSIAPEILLGLGCCTESDIFGCGVVLYGALSSTLPFMGADIKSTHRACVEANVVFPEALFAVVSSDSRHFVKLMLQRHVRHRPSARDAIVVLDRCVVAAQAMEPASYGTSLPGSLHVACEHATNVSAGLARNPRPAGPREIAVGRNDASAASVAPELDASVASPELPDEQCAEERTSKATDAEVAEVAANRRRQRSFLRFAGRAFSFFWWRGRSSSRVTSPTHDEGNTGRSFFGIVV